MKKLIATILGGLLFVGVGIIVASTTRKEKA